MVSYNDCPIIRELYSGYTITAVSRINSLAQRYESGSEYQEVIITNYDPGKENGLEQLSLFSLLEADDRYETAGNGRIEREE